MARQLTKGTWQCQLHCKLLQQLWQHTRWRCLHGVSGSLTYLLLSWPVSVGETLWTKLLSACGALSLIFISFLAGLQWTEALMCCQVWLRKMQLHAQTQSSSHLVTRCACPAAVDPSSLQPYTVSPRRPTSCC